MIKKFNISKPKKYTTKTGEEKTQWNNIGTITEFHKDDGSISRIIEIPAIGLEANIFPFVENKPEQTNGYHQGNGGNVTQSNETPDYPEEDLGESTPF